MRHHTQMTHRVSQDNFSQLCWGGVLIPARSNTWYSLLIFETDFETWLSQFSSYLLSSSQQREEIVSQHKTH